MQTRRGCRQEGTKGERERGRQRARGGRREAAGRGKKNVLSKKRVFRARLDAVLKKKSGERREERGERGEGGRGEKSERGRVRQVASDK